MSKGKILVTDSLFIFDRHVRRMEDAGYEVVRVDESSLSESDLCDVVADKVGYILGGVEYVTDKVVNAASNLKALVFTGTGYKGHIPGWQLALEHGILIGTTPYANVYEVAEWGVAATLAMQRDLFELGPQGSTRYHTVTSLPDLKVGVIGMGHIGQKYADMIKSLGAGEVVYWNRTPKQFSYAAVEKEELFKTCDIIFVALADDVGSNYISGTELNEMKQDALLVSIAHHGIINEADLCAAVSGGAIRAALDIVKDQEQFEGLSPSRWYASKASSAYNSIGFLNRCSDMATSTLLNLLDKGVDTN